MFKYVWSGVIGGLAVMLGVVAVQVGFASIADFLLLFLLLLPVPAMLAATPYVMRRIELFRFRRIGARRRDLSETRGFGPEGFISAPSWQEPVPWHFITKVVESENFFFLYHSGGQPPEYVPKAAMNDAERNELRSILQARLNAQTAQLKLFPAPR